MNITQGEAQQIMECMPEGTTHFWFTDRPWFSIFDGCGIVQPNLFEKWDNTHHNEYYEWCKYRGWVRWYNVNPDFSKRIPIINIRNIAYPESQPNYTDQFPINSAIDLLKSNGYIVSKIV